MFKIIKNNEYKKLLNQIEELKFEINLKDEILKTKEIVDNFEESKQNFYTNQEFKKIIKDTKKEIEEKVKDEIKKEEEKITFPILEEEIDLTEFKTILKENEKIYCKKACSREYAFSNLYEKIGLYKNCDGILKLKESFENVHVFGIFTNESVDTDNNFRTVQKVIKEQKLRNLDSILQIIEEIKIRVMIENL